MSDPEKRNKISEYNRSTQRRVNKQRQHRNNQEKKNKTRSPHGRSLRNQGNPDQPLKIETEEKGHGMTRINDPEKNTTETERVKPDKTTPGKIKTQVLLHV